MSTAATAQTPAECVLAAVRADPHPAAEALQVTPEQVLNLVQLAQHLRRVYPAGRAASFNMRTYYSIPDAAFDHIPIKFSTEQVFNTLQPHECGTVACAVGHGPAAGLRFASSEGWNDYAARVFGARPGRVLFDYLFQDQWAQLDNTPRGAAARICRALQHGPGWRQDADAVERYQEYVA